MILFQISKSVRKYLSYFALFLLFAAGSDSLAAQDKFSVSGGLGYYELTNIGFHWNSSAASSFSIYGGTNFGMGNTRYLSLGLSFAHVYQKPLFWKIKAGYSLGLIYWTSDDDLYNFTNLALPLMALLEYPLSKSFKIRAEGGILFNAVLTSDRKQNIEAGYPERFNGNAALSLIYKFGSK